MKLCIECNSEKQAEKYKPFCSKRCADVDLHRWNTGSYSIPTNEQPNEQQITEEKNEY